MPKLYIETLFDRINGGDDVDAAEEAENICTSMLAALKELKEWAAYTGGWEGIAWKRANRIVRVAEKGRK